MFFNDFTYVGRKCASFGNNMVGISAVQIT